MTLAVAFVAVLPSIAYRRGRLLGALEATNGVLMFGLTTGVLFSVFSALLRRVWDAQHGVSEAR